MTNQKTFSCVVMGDGTLPVACSSILLEAGHRIVGTFSNVGPLRDWSTERGIQAEELTIARARTLADQEFDYLFSIVNPLILPDEIIEFAGQGAYNYHDAPLPRYAGLHATSWAIINQEQQHGISWHELAGRIDGGGIVCAEKIQLEPRMTALLLNVTCYDAAIRAFRRLIKLLEEGPAVPLRQDLSNRTYYPRFKRPEAACTIDWQRPAVEIDALVRGLDMGPYPSPLGKAKFFTGTDFLLLTKTSVRESETTGAAGTITRLDSSRFFIATARGVVSADELATLDGMQIRIDDLKTRYGWDNGTVLPELGIERRRRIDRLVTETAPSETFWKNRLASCVPDGLTSQQSQPPQNLSAVSTFTLTVPATLMPWTMSVGVDQVDALLTALALSVGLTLDSSLAQVAYKTDELLQRLDRLSTLFADSVPFHLSWDNDDKLEEIVERTRIERDRIELEGTYLRDLAVRYPELAGKPVTLPLTFSVQESPRSLNISDGSLLRVVYRQSTTEVAWQFDPASIRAELVENLLAGYQNILRAIIEEPGCTVGSLSRRTGDDTEASARQKEPPTGDPVAFNLETRPSLSGRDSILRDRRTFVHRMFEQYAESSPHAVALRFNDETITYRALNERSNQLAHRLRKRGVDADQAVGLCLDRSVEMIVGMLAILKAGGAYLPLDPAYPEDRIRYMVTNSKACLLLTRDRYRTVLPGSVPVLAIDDEAVSNESTDNPSLTIESNNLIYVTYTSGSTGRPKGVAMPHGSLARLIEWQTQVSFLGPGTLTVQFAGLAFDASASEIFSSLCSGGMLLLIDEHVRFSSVDLLRTIRRTSATRLTLTFSLLRLFCETANELGLYPTSLREVISTGEQLQVSSPIRAFFRQMPSCRLRNEYGPSEAHTVASYTLPEDVSRWPSLPPIGRPLPHARLYLLDESMHPVDSGTQGELYIGGDVLAREYHNDPALTADRFINDPFSRVVGARMYRTGDICRRRSDGFFEFAGRSDTQIKLRGVRIELGEIESVLADHNAVERCAVGRVTGSDGHDKIIAYVVPRQHFSDGDLREFLAEKLPGVMLPVAFHRLEALPLLPSGKIDRQTLSTLHTPEFYSVDHRERLMTKTEAALHKIWCEVLNRESVGLSERLFDIGGDSLSGMRILNRIQTMTGVDLPLRDLFRAQTILEQARLIEHYTGN